MARLSLFLALAAAAAAPVVGQCTTKSQRKAWHTYTDEEKKAYIDAELCLMEKEPIQGYPTPAKNRHEELQTLHVLRTGINHGTGSFLPFHRLFVHAHEHLLKTECGYEGTQPYWDIPHDVGNLEGSALVDPDTGFGGNGAGEDGCIQDGPFAGYINSLGPGYTYTDTCIRRNFNETYLILGGDDFLEASLKRTKHEDADPYIQAGPHNSGHCAIGGLMSDPVASPGDPIFYLHHTWLDKVFWDWQSADLPARLEDIGLPNGFIIFDPTNPPPQPPALEGDPYMFGIPADVYPTPEQLIPLPESPPQVPVGDPGNVTTLSHVLDMMGIIPNATIGDVMDIAGGLLCYEYV